MVLRADPQATTAYGPLRVRTIVERVLKAAGGRAQLAANVRRIAKLAVDERATLSRAGPRIRSRNSVAP